MPVSFKVALLCVLALGFFFRAHRLGDKILWIDEGISWKVASFKNVNEIIEYNRYEEHTPLPQIIDHYWIKMAGDSVAALHLESLIFSTLALLIFTATVFSCMDWRAAFASTVAYSLSAALPSYAQTLRHPALASLFTQIWLFALFAYMKNKKPSALLLYFAALSICVYIHMYTLYTIAGLALYFIMFRKEIKGQVVALMAASVAAICSIIPKFLTMRETGVDKLGTHVPLGEAIAHLQKLPVGGLLRNMIFFCIGDTLIVEQLPVVALVLILAFYVYIAIMALANKDFRSVAAMSVIVLATALSLGFLGMVFKGFYFYAKYYSAIVSLFSILFGIGVAQIWKTNRNAAIMAMAISGAISATILQTYYWSNLDRPENMKTILQHVKDNEKPGDFLNISPPYTYNFDYYWKGNMPVRDFSNDFDPKTTPHNNIFLITAKNRQMTDARVERWHRQLASKHKRVWMFWILGTANTEDKDRVAEKWLNSHYREIERIPYRQMPYMRDYSGVMVLYEIKDH